MTKGVGVKLKAITALLGAVLGVVALAQGHLGPHTVDPLEIVGHVYEDLAPLGVNHGEDVGVAGASVYVFFDANENGVLDAGDVEEDMTATGADGTFSLTVLPPEGGGTYFVVVDSRTVGTTRGLNDGFAQEDIWAEQTYQTEYVDGEWISVKKFGGQDPDVSDDFASGVYEHQVKVISALYGGTPLDFGFSFEVIVSARDVDEDGTSGTGRSAQGTLRQFLENARAIQGPDRSYFVFTHGSDRRIEVDPDLWMYGGSNYNRKAHPGYVVDADTHLDGRVLDWDLQPTGEVIWLDATSYPEDSFLFLAKGNGVTMENLEIQGHRYHVGTPDMRGIRLSGATDGVFQDIEVYECHVGIEIYWNCHRNQFLRIHAHHNDHSGIYFQDYWARSSYNDIRDSYIYDNGINGIGFSWDNDYCTIQGNIVEDNGYAGIWIGYACDHNVVQGNTVRGNAVVGISLSSWPGYPPPMYNEVIGNTVEGNGWATVGPWGPVEYGSGIGLYNADDNVVRGNTVRDNYSTETTVYGVSINADSTGNTVAENEITGNGVGIGVIDDASVNNVITRNSIYKNAGLGIDLGADGVSHNDGVLGSPNRGVDYPVFTEAKANPDGTVYVEGFVGPEEGGGSAAFAGATVEIFLVTNGIEGDDLVGNEYDGRNYGEGWRYLGDILVGADGTFSGVVDLGGIEIGPRLLITGTVHLAGAGTSEFGPTLDACHPHDLTGDCALGLEDVRLVQLMARGCISVDSKADLDGDGDVDLDDARLYAEIFLGGD